MQSFLDIHTTSKQDLRSIIDGARRMKDARNGAPKGTPDTEQPLANRMVALIFEKPSTRTRVSFDLGVRQMGGQTMVLSGKEMQLGHGETIADTARAGDVVICMGAGSIGGVPAKVVELLKD